MYLAEMPSLSLKITPPGTYPVSSVYCVVSTSSVNKHVFHYPLLHRCMLCSMNPLKELQLGWGVDNVEAGQSISGSENRCLLPAALAHHCCPTLSHTGQLYWPQPSDLSAQLVPTTPSTSYLANQPTNIFMMSESRIS